MECGRHWNNLGLVKGLDKCKMQSEKCKLQIVRQITAIVQFSLSFLAVTMDLSNDSCTSCSAFVLQVRHSFSFGSSTRSSIIRRIQNLRFSQFLQADAQFVNKVRTALRRTAFFVVRCCRRARSHQLRRNVTAQSCRRQCVHCLSDANCKNQQAAPTSRCSCRDLRWLHFAILHFAFFILHFSIRSTLPLRR